LENKKAEGLLIDLDSSQTALVNISQTFIRSALILKEEMGKKDRPVSAIREVYAPYVIINQTGYPIVIWADGLPQDGEFELVELTNGMEKPWMAGDWRRIRDAKGGSSFVNRDRIAIQFKGDKTWETVRNVSLENEGFKIYPLRPKQETSHKLVVDISLVKTVKYVRIRSSVVLRNATSIPMEFILTNTQGQILTNPVTIEPNKSGSIPIDSGYYHSVKIRPSKLIFIDGITSV
jgi:hypothetical protein